MSDHVWISTAPGHGSKLRPLRNNFWSENSEEEAVLRETTAKIRDGIPFSENEAPSEVYGAPNAKDKDYAFPDLFYAYGFWIVSSSAADVIRQFDLGGGGLFPVKVLKKDRETPVGGEWFCINFGNQKAAFVAAESENKSERYIRNGLKGWFARAAMKDLDFAVTGAAISGPDIWVDPIVGDTVFLSRALGDALKKAKADKGFFLKKCRIV